MSIKTRATIGVCTSVAAVGSFLIVRHILHSPFGIAA